MELSLMCLISSFNFMVKFVLKIVYGYKIVISLSNVF